MAKLTKMEMQALASGIATLMSLASISLLPTQTKMASRSVGHLLWLMGVEKFEAHGMTFVAAPPEGEIVDMDLSNRLLDLRANPSEGSDNEV